MTVHPGFGGQSFISDAIKKIDKLKKRVLCGVDGGVTLDNIHLVRKFYLIVIGSSYFKSKNKKEFIEKALKLIS
ncbi:Ribulose-phosphate 3-epimerase [Nosema bombycis CQ1]|uniref:Ribulose-phosphate 3-epimerase n=1 Tax=Nosema bombycis (strain CQ1 / CVCC 102059) TaxID=578461 RepID=R0ML59_NOSB1|nr:Ribulose-phosphate 3-epimerase [Nosema bombycis CQ1]|eukprot:EOB13548.1 Ribulose-phosphate 3-epimerase [Nosema bombycis CQ1]